MVSLRATVTAPKPLATAPVPMPAPSRSRMRFATAPATQMERRRLAQAADSDDPLPPSVITQGVNRGHRVSVLSIAAMSPLVYHHHKMKSADDWIAKQRKGVAQALGSHKWRQVTAAMVDRNEVADDLGLLYSPAVLESLGGKTESSSGVVAFVDAGGLPGAGSAAVLARLLHAAGAGVGETGTRSAEARAHSQPELVALSQRALCDMGSDGSMASSEWTVASSRWQRSSRSAGWC